jgi:hypothetical protein
MEDLFREWWYKQNGARLWADASNGPALSAIEMVFKAGMKARLEQDCKELGIDISKID